ncbi:non-structural maintenance of chromosomes element 1 homolog [Haliotis cracherodii]|uniref:non-structural maintenance of chromosomes element 1 homolog n=1 Tax=Haliotis cracherodii TaxID=6455 RepID=UPI0039E7F7C9
MGDMNDCHRMFLQKFMSQSLLNAKEVKQLFKQCCDKYSVSISEDDPDAKKRLFEFVRIINANIHQFHMEIKKAISEDDGSNHYGLVNISRTDITKMASDYNQNELEFFKKLVELVVESDDGTVGSIETLNLTEKLEKKISKNDAQDLLDRMSRDQWIAQKAGRVSLHTRAVLELEQYIKEYFVEAVKMCNMCNKLCLKGQTCEECGIKIHFHCAVRYFSHREAQKCPSRECGAAWTHDIPKRDMNSTQATQEDQAASSHVRKRKHHT